MRNAHSSILPSDVWMGRAEGACRLSSGAKGARQDMESELFVDELEQGCSNTSVVFLCLMGYISSIKMVF